jgi:hypothetical protein
MRPSVGTTLVSTTDATAVIVVRWGGAGADVTCGGAPMVDARGPEAGATQQPDPAQQDGTLLGKRYADEELGVEVLCTKAGSGTLAVDGRPLAIKTAKPLPASD